MPMWSAAAMLLTMSIDQTQMSRRAPKCVVCGEAIGVYEPLTHVLGDLARRTSRGAEPEVCSSHGVCYHADCYDRRTLVI
jgi:hypothetical protein